MKLLAEHYHSVFQYPDKNLVRELLALVGDGALLDLGCATGRVLEIVRDLNVDAYGIDSSSEMIRFGQSRFVDAQSRVQFIQADIREFQSQLEGKVGLVTCLANTYSMLLTESDRVSVLSNAYRYLVPKGCFFIYVKSDKPDPQATRKMTVATPSGDLNFVLSYYEDLNHGLRRYSMSFDINNEHEDYEFLTKMSKFEDLSAEFIDTGFKIKETFCDYNKQSLSKDASLWFFVLEK